MNKKKKEKRKEKSPSGGARKTREAGFLVSSKSNPKKQCFTEKSKICTHSFGIITTPVLIKTISLM